MSQEQKYLQGAKHLPFQLLSPQEAAQLLRVSRGTIYAWCRQGILKPAKVRSVEGKKGKFTGSFFTIQALLKLIKWRFPEILPDQKKEIRERLKAHSG